MAYLTNNSDYTEKRRYPRYPSKVHCDLTTETNDFNVICKTKDLSPIGASLIVGNKIPEMTRFNIFLKLPDGHVTCEGTVVRSEKKSSENNSHEIAIYFNEISDPEKKKISDFLYKYPKTH